MPNEPPPPAQMARGRSENSRRYLIDMKVVGGRDGTRTRGPLLAKRAAENTKVLRWYRFHGKSIKLPPSKCLEVLPSSEFHNATVAPVLK